LLARGGELNERGVVIAVAKPTSDTLEKKSPNRNFNAVRPFGLPWIFGPGAPIKTPGFSVKDPRSHAVVHLELFSNEKP